MAKSQRFYLVVVANGEARLVAEPAVLRGKGLERYGKKEDLLDTLQAGGSKQAVVIKGNVIALGDPRVARQDVKIAGEVVPVMVVCVDGTTPSTELRRVQHWLALAVLNAGGELRPIKSVPTSSTPLDLSGAFKRDWRPPALMLLIGLFFGVLAGVLLAGGDETVDALVSGQTSVTTATASDGDNARAGTAAGAQRLQGPGAGQNSAGQIGDDPAGLVVTLPDAPSATDVAAGSAVGDAARLTVAALIARPKLALWNGKSPPTVETISTHCNSYGDLVLTAIVDNKEVKRVVACGLFQRQKAPGKTRVSVCIPELSACAMLSDVDLQTAPAYICTPRTGAPYGLMKARGNRQPGYRKGRAQAGFETEEGVAVRSRCRRGAPYARLLRKLH